MGFREHQSWIVFAVSKGKCLFLRELAFFPSLKNLIYFSRFVLHDSPFWIKLIPININANNTAFIFTYVIVCWASMKESHVVECQNFTIIKFVLGNIFMHHFNKLCKRFVPQQNIIDWLSEKTVTLRVVVIDSCDFSFPISATINNKYNKNHMNQKKQKIASMISPDNRCPQ